MSKEKTKLQPAKWQITATTIHCELVDDFVTIMVNKDWSTKCAWYKRYKQKALDDKKQKFDSKIRLMIQKCQGPECSYVTGYRDELIKEEFGGK
ncbi:MAG: hypothetical protein A2Z75_03795 [Chloroflexi bacterium RBG_13_50_10]|nr:MAG: hypothetical protein A2Z75_03795 [Chloroflexi bacterium RBG_13_50_10]